MNLLTKVFNIVGDDELPEKAQMVMDYLQTLCSNKRYSKEFYRSTLPFNITSMQHSKLKQYTRRLKILRRNYRKSQKTFIGKAQFISQTLNTQINDQHGVLRWIIALWVSQLTHIESSRTLTQNLERQSDITYLKEQYSIQRLSSIHWEKSPYDDKEENNCLKIRILKTISNSLYLLIGFVGDIVSNCLLKEPIQKLRKKNTAVNETSILKKVEKIIFGCIDFKIIVDCVETQAHSFLKSQFCSKYKKKQGYALRVNFETIMEIRQENIVKLESLRELLEKFIRERDLSSKRDAMVKFQISFQSLFPFLEAEIRNMTIYALMGEFDQNEQIQLAEKVYIHFLYFEAMILCRSKLEVKNWTLEQLEEEEKDRLSVISNFLRETVKNQAQKPQPLPKTYLQLRKMSYHMAQYHQLRKLQQLELCNSNLSAN